jgi:hypothetical protein
VTLQLFFIADEDQFEIGVSVQTRIRRTYHDFGAEVAAHGIE